MTKIVKSICFVVIALSLIMAQGAKADEVNKNSKINIVVTTFPLYDFLREIIGTSNPNLNVKIIIDNGIDLHNFQPSTEDIADISNAHVFVYNGGESDIWVKKILSQAMNKNMKVIDIMSLLGDRVKKELIVEGMQEVSHVHHNHSHEGHDCDDHDHKGHDHGTHSHHEHEGHNHQDAVYDEHVWLSLKNVLYICKMLLKELQSIDTVNAALYAENAQKYMDKVAALDAKYAEIFAKAKNKTVLFADRFPFRYLLDDYNISYFAAFPGCSAETEASFSTVIFLSKKINELNLNKVFIIDESTNNIASAIIQNSNNKDAQTLSLDSLQTVTSKELSEGVSYLAIMEQNLENLTKALK